jgi:hypothetical protein
MKSTYKVFNYGSLIDLPTQDEKYALVLQRGDLVTLEPSVKELTFEQIEWINYKSKVINLSAKIFLA